MEDFKMASRKVFSNEGNELECYLNTDNELFIEVGEECAHYVDAWITLDKQDVSELIICLQEHYKEM